MASPFVLIARNPRQAPSGFSECPYRKPSYRVRHPLYPNSGFLPLIPRRMFPRSLGREVCGTIVDSWGRDMVVLCFPEKEVSSRLLVCRLWKQRYANAKIGLQISQTLVCSVRILPPSSIQLSLEVCVENLRAIWRHFAHNHDKHSDLRLN